MYFWKFGKKVNAYIFDIFFKKDMVWNDIYLNKP